MAREQHTAASPAAAQAELKTRSDRFVLAGRPFDMWGIRVASATVDQAQTDHLIAQLDEYKAHGINTVTVFYQGCSGASYEPFSADGLRIDAGHQERMEQIIRAAAERGMVVVVGIFYQNAPFGLKDAEAVRNAVRTVTRNLQPYRNLILNIANEQNSGNWNDTKSIYDFTDPVRIIELCEIARKIDRERLVGGGGYDHDKNIIIGRSPAVDVLLFDTSGPKPDSGELYDRFVAAGVTVKPIVNVETFGGWTKPYPKGVFPAEVRQAYLNEVDAAAARLGLTIFFHNNPWLQATPMRYDLGGRGTDDDPGIRWYFQYVRNRRERAVVAVKPDDRIQPYRQNPFYWQYKGQPVLLLGGTDDHNLFQWEEPRLRRHLDLLAAVGGNYVRNTMSTREEGNVQPFARRSDGRYDLDRWNDEYWQRFRNLMKLAHERDIIVQIELWDRFDFAREPWVQNAYNPENNVTYTAGQSRLETRYPQHPGGNQNPFFRTVPGLDNNEVVLRFQQAQVDRMLDISLDFPNVLYCMDNETSGRPEWGAYWANTIRRKAEERGVAVHTTEMWDPWDLGDPLHRNTFDHPETYTFIDISQNNHQKGQTHWDNMQQQRRRIAARPRPMNNVKIYGADTGRYGTDRDGVERFWRSVIGGMASARFHRPVSGLGLSEAAQANMRSMRKLAAEFDFFRAVPDANSELLQTRDENEAYLSSIKGEAYAVYFPAGGSVRLDLSGASGDFALRWLNIARSGWQPAVPLQPGRAVELTPPDSGAWVALIRR